MTDSCFKLYDFYLLLIDEIQISYWLLISIIKLLKIFIYYYSEFISDTFYC